MSRAETDPVALWAGMIVQEGKEAALEIAETCGVEAALDAMQFINENRQTEMLRYRSALSTVILQTCNAQTQPASTLRDSLGYACKTARDALASPSTHPKED